MEWHVIKHWTASRRWVHHVIPSFITLLFVFPVCLQSKAQGEPDSLNDFKFLTNLPSDLNEISGMVVHSNGNLLGINDGGNPAELIEFSPYNGQVKNKFPLKQTTNVDWEAIVKDHRRMLYIADFGNNANTRKDLCIYAIHEDSITNPESNLRKISFRYENQTSFPPVEDSMWFDAEAMYHHNDTLWIITKNRSKPFDGRIFLYFLPLNQGDTLVASLHNVLKYTSGSIKELEWVTDAFYDFWKADYGIMLLNHTKVLRVYPESLKVNFPDDLPSGTLYEVTSLGTFQQFEAIIGSPGITLGAGENCNLNCYLLACESSPFGPAALYSLKYKYIINDVPQVKKEVPYHLKSLPDGSLHIHYTGAFSLEIYGLEGKLLFSQSAENEIILPADIHAKRPFVLHVKGKEGSVNRLLH